MWQKQGCPASVYSKYFICQIPAALVTISSIISFAREVCLHCILNFPSSPCLFFFPRTKCSFPYSLSQAPRLCCKGASLCDYSVCVVKSSWWLRSLRSRWATGHILSSFLCILCEWCRYLKIIHILESLSVLFGWDDADALTGWITSQMSSQEPVIEPPNPDPAVNNPWGASFIGLKLCLEEPDPFPPEWVIYISGKIKLL